MFGLYMLAIYLGVAVIAAGFITLLVGVALAVGLVTHLIRTLAIVFHKLAALSAAAWRRCSLLSSTMVPRRVRALRA